MGKIVAIGGGELRAGETRAIDARIVELTGKSTPRALFIPTASGDAVDYDRLTFRPQYGDALGCQTDVLYLLKNRPSSTEIAAKIAAADLIYVGGGNTLRMMKLWRRLGVDELLRQAYVRGTVLCGVSAGAMCWFNGGHSDSRSFATEAGEAWSYIRVRGLGLADALYCPHVDGENRLPSFQQFMRRFPGVGIGCDNGCAIEIQDGTCRILTSLAGAKAYRVYRQRGQIITEILPSGSEYPAAELFTR